MMCPVRRLSVALTGLVSLAALALVGGVGTAGTAEAAAGATSASGSPSVRTVLGPGIVAGPGGIALDAADNLFVANVANQFERVRSEALYCFQSLGRRAQIAE